MAVLSINPATEEVMARLGYIDRRKASEEVRRSREAFEGWRALETEERCGYLAKAAAILKKNSRKYGSIMTSEMGKPITQAIAEAEKCAWACEYYSKNAGDLLRDREVSTDAKKSFVSFEPLGVILGVMPWNFPFWQVFRFASATIAAGNTVVVKHSSNVPLCGIAIEEVFREAGFPEHVYKNLLVNSETVGSIVEGDLVEGISLTGSTEAGARIGELGGRNIKKVVLELGGSDPFVVLDGADVKRSAETAVTARFQNNGQSCIAAKRFIVHKDIAEEFKRAFVEGTKKLIVGDPSDTKTSVGPLARGDLRDTIEKQLKTALDEGSRTLCGGKRIRAKGYFFEPTVIQAPKESRTVNEEEFFGPLASIIIGKDEGELLDIANSSRYGLGASVWCEDRGRAEAFARKVGSGMVAVNNMLRSDPRMPFGGIKKSGIGRELGSFGVMEFVNIKGVSIY